MNIETSEIQIVKGSILSGGSMWSDFSSFDTNTAKTIERKIANLTNLSYDYVLLMLNFDTSYGFYVYKCPDYEKTDLYRIRITFVENVAGEKIRRVYGKETDKKDALAIFRDVCIKRNSVNLSDWEDMQSKHEAWAESEYRIKNYGRVLDKYYKLKSTTKHDDYIYNKTLSDIDNTRIDWTNHSLYLEFSNKNYKKIIKLFEEHPDNPILAENMGDVYCYGYGVDIDYEKALSYYNYATLRGNLIAQYKLGLMYKYGLGCTVNTKNYETLVKLTYKTVKAYNKFLLPCFTEVILELSKIEFDKGNAKRSLSYAKEALKNEKMVLCMPRCRPFDRILKIINQIYKLAQFDDKKMDVYDIYYVLQSNSQVTFMLNKRRYIITSQSFENYQEIKFNGKVYRGINRFIENATLKNNYLTFYNDEIKDIEVIKWNN